MKIQINTPGKKLYALLIISVLFIGSGKAQIVYTDINPDTTITTAGSNNNITKTHHLDLNNDGLTDFKLIATFRGGAFGNVKKEVRITPANSNKVIEYDTIYNLTVPLSVNSIISNTGKWWSNDSNQILTAQYYTSSYGLWNSSADAYLGLKLVNGQNIFYGWAKLSVATHASSFTIKDYAYNSIPNQPILAGETSCVTPTVNLTQSGSLSFCAGDSVIFTANGTGYLYQWKKNNVNISGATAKTYVAKTAGIYKCNVTNSCGSKTSGTRTVTIPCRRTNKNFAESSQHLSVFPNPANNSVTVNLHSEKDENTEPAEVQIINLFGEIIFSEKIITDQTEIDVSKFSAGMYLVRWNSGENTETKTFSIVK